MIKFPTSLDSIFQIMDIPEKFANERSESPFFLNLIDNIQDPDNTSQTFLKEELKKCFMLSHISTKWFNEMNFLLRALYSDLKRSSEGKSSLLHGIFSIIYTTWDYSFFDSDYGMESGKNRLNKYFQDNFYVDLPDNQKYIADWIRQNLDLNRVLKMINAKKLPFNDDFSDVSDTDQLVIKALRDAQIYGPFYSLEFYFDLKDKVNLINEILLISILQYGVSDLTEIEENLYKYYHSSTIHPPYMEFTQNLISSYSNKLEHDGTRFFTTDLREKANSILESQYFQSIHDEMENSDSPKIEFTENSIIF